MARNLSPNNLLVEAKGSGKPAPLALSSSCCFVAPHTLSRVSIMMALSCEHFQWLIVSMFLFHIAQLFPPTAAFAATLDGIQNNISQVKKIPKAPPPRRSCTQLRAPTLAAVRGSKPISRPYTPFPGGLATDALPLLASPLRTRVGSSACIPPQLSFYARNCPHLKEICFHGR